MNPPIAAGPGRYGCLRTAGAWCWEWAGGCLLCGVAFLTRRIGDHVYAGFSVYVDYFYKS